MREAGKVVVASVAGVAASGGYYIAMGCEKIVCDELSITGSIGVVQSKFAFGELYDKVLSVSPYDRGGASFFSDMNWQLNWLVTRNWHN